MTIMYFELGTNHKSVTFKKGKLFQVAVVEDGKMNQVPIAEFATSVAAFEYVQIMNEREEGLNKSKN